mgnify:FL=1
MDYNNKIYIFGCIKICMEKEIVLRSLGLKDDETKVYIELLKLGQSKVNNIARKVNLPRTTVYNILNSLSLKGLVSYTIRSGVKFFESVDPNRLIQLEQEKIGNLKSILPDLEGMKNVVVEKPRIEIFEGKEGIKSILEDILKTGESMAGYSIMELLNLLGYYFPNFIKRRVKLGIKTRVIMAKSAETVELKKNDKNELREIRFMPEASRFRLGCYVYGNKVAILITKKEEPLGILIENRELAETQRVIFERLWKIAKKV